MNDPEPIDYEFANCTLRRWNHDYLETLFRDGTKTRALFTYGTESAAQAVELGYGENVRAMHLDHEICHTLLSEALGRPYSLTLYHVAHRPFYPEWFTEEKMVLAFQKWTRGGKVDPALAPLLATAPLEPLLRKLILIRMELLMP